MPEFGGLEALDAIYVRRTFPRHMHEEYVIAVMTVGAEAVEYRGISYSAAPGEVVLINPGEWHANRGLTESFGYRTLYVSAPFLMQLSSGVEAAHSRPPDLQSKPVCFDETLQRLLLQFHSALQKGAIALEKESCLLECLTYLFFRREYVSGLDSLPKEAGWVRRVREYLDQHYDQNVSLSEISKIADVTPFHLLRTFREQIGVPPHAYQIHCRVARARRLLRAGMPIAEVAAAVGFFDQSHFNRHFARIVGITPRCFSKAQ